ncbi:hypothetical protein [Hyphomicrobium sp. CS1GBMeth3]|uniref:hypothetical protein n=1 Tax=Hyphomicrobium sp. CS1GBMeth3 TaxID=1892845 RepID=UPI000930032A|nr:hypothetical protein [Hyphomicrobium sp. CS1GBMeth3]
MAERLRDQIRAAWQAMAPRLRRVVVHGLVALRALWYLIRPPLSFALQVVAALILLFEEWGWRPLVQALAYLTRFKLWQRIELFIAGLPPYGALAALALPTSLLFPLKFVAVYLLATGQVAAASLLFIGAKIASTALIARIFLLTRPALMQIGWFRTAYDIIMPWKEALFEWIRASWVWRYGRMLKTRVRIEIARAWMRLKPRLEQAAGRIRLALARAIGRA